jgi:ABC-2 type transport system permease protein
MAFWSKPGALWWREITRFRRQRSRLLGALLQPLVFWLLLGAGLKASFRPAGLAPGVSYVRYFYAGVLVLVLLFTAIFSTISVVEDRRQGYLQGVLVAPIGRGLVVLAQAAGATTLAMGEGVIFLLLGPLAGISPGPWQAAWALVVMAVLAFTLSSVGLAIAWRIESTQGFHTVMNLILIPLWLLSGAFFPAAGTPLWLRWAMRLDPLSWGMSALQRLLLAPALATPGWSELLRETVVAALFAALAFAAAVASARRSPVGAP